MARSAARSSSAPMICGSVWQLLEGVALGDPLGAERDVDLAAASARCWATYAVVPG